MGLSLKCGKEGYMRVQDPEKLLVNVRRRQLVAAKAEIGIMEELENEKPVES